MPAAPGRRNKLWEPGKILARKEKYVIKLAPLFILLLLAAALPGAGPSRCLPAYGDQQYTREQLVTMYPGFYFYRGPREANRVALTFDDGPDDQATPQILDILKENSVHATFFLIGSYARLNPDIVRRIAAEGNIIGNHTWSHTNMLRLNPEQARQEIAKTENILVRITGCRTALLRPPRGKISPTIMDVARKEGYRVIGWSVDSVDWRDPVTARITARLRDQMHPGAIILMHSVDLPTSKGVTVKVLPGLIRELKARGYQLVTLDELLHISAYGPPEPACFVRPPPGIPSRNKAPGRAGSLAGDGRRLTREGRARCR